MSSISLNHGSLDLPIFLPDATLGVVRSLDTVDLTNSGVQGLVMNVFHLMQKPGTSTIQALGGLNKMTGWDGPIITDSGGFQAYSIIHEQPNRGSVNDKGMSVKNEHTGRKFSLTPEKSVQLQINYGADIIMCLDECTHVDAPYSEQTKAVERTIKWAQRSKKEFNHQIIQRGWHADRHPLIFGVIQGGRDLPLRKRCADALLEIGFDGFGYGGWPLDESGALLKDILTATRSYIPSNFHMHALGVGHPESISTCVNMGYTLFDSSLPTRDARRGRLYTTTKNPDEISYRSDENWFDMVYLQDRKHIKNNRPISPYCTCYTCSRYSIGYLHHLFACNEMVVARLATLHNLSFMTSLMKKLRDNPPS
jgi:queuine tRNA-ribosyltransferase